MAYTSEDPSIRLAAVRAAISNCLSAQEYEVGGTGTNRGTRRQAMADLKDLRELEKDLMQEVLDAASGGMASLAIMPPVT